MAGEIARDAAGRAGRAGRSRRPRGRGRRRGLAVGQWLAFSIGLLLVLAVAGIGLALAANARLADRRNLLVDQIQPAQ
ncbi:MAG: hypothetical protein ABSG43_25510, partial [Solirubrobacteraceae bacterium]